MLYKHYGINVIILIDEYDVPLDKAYFNGYYSEMVGYMRLLFGKPLKQMTILNLQLSQDVLESLKKAYLQASIISKSGLWQIQLILCT